ncbi:hypothetical protein JOE61_002738 [Nocardioides salarius]|uniref:Uncharacterized protein n=1 Tax=Nocardioides salarius TaxID=374513 RepID=A0ABS2MCJ8_9ACTN|nr:hypothetical protein [Nocardioides salarius]MBM7508924.1 hypothetical protein [Nocardioides salarius]
MDLSALIFVALAVAWAVYLVPKALKHHDDVVRSRSVDRFSQTMRVLARREPVSRRSARLVVTPGRASAPPVVVTKASSASVGSEPAPASTPAPVPAVETSLDASALPPVRTPAQRRAAANRAARRRRRVLVALLGALAAVGVLSIAGLLGPAYLGVPVGLLVAWLVACRLMVRRETGLAGPLARIPAVPLDDDGAQTEVPAADEADEADMTDVTDDAAEGPQTEEVPVVQPEVAAEAPAAGWDPVPVTLPTYVTKPAAERRTVRTIDLDSTGVWTSGRTEVDAALAREGDQAERERRARRDQGDEGRAVGT